MDSENGGSTDTESDDVDFSAVDHLPSSQQGEAIYWAYNQAKTAWRRFSQKPTRHVRRFVKKKGGGKGKRGNAVRAFITDTDHVSSYLKGKGKNTRSHTSGKGFHAALRKNPKGPDGQIMKCSTCNSEDHFRARCPHNTQQRPAATPFLATPASQGQPAESSSASGGPLGDLEGILGEIEVSYMNLELPEEEDDPIYSTHDAWEGATLG